MAVLAEPRLDAGSRVGRYHLIEPIGRGGSAVVYAAIDPRTGARLAVKCLCDPSKASRLHRFHREYAFMARLHHPGILRALGFGHFDGLPWYATELAPGGRLRAAYRGAAPSMATLVDHGIQLCEALAYLHDRRIVHRDVKPANVLLDEAGRCRLADFGLAVDLEAGPQPRKTPRLHGTLSYASPEQARGRPVDHRADLYSLGVTLYELATGRRPFVADSIEGVLVKHVKEAPEPPRRWNPSIPPALEALILQLMEKSPWDRPDGARWVLAALEAIPAGQLES